MRVYLAATMPALRAALEAGEIGPAPLAGFAVTPALRESYASGDEEELEYAAMAVAARASLRLLAAADRGDDDAKFTVDGAEGNELLWYAVQELPYLFE